MKKSKIGRNILKVLLMCGAIYFTMSSPAAARKFIKRLPKELKKYRRSQVLSALYHLEKQNNIEYANEVNGDITVKITENGKDYFKRLDFDNLALDRPEKWDEKWRLVIFDIPERKKLIREALRNKLKDMRFKKIQGSIWVTPFPCEKEIKLVKSVFGLSNFWIDIILTEHIGIKEYQLRRYFDLI